MGSETTLAPSQCGKAFGSTDSNLVGYDGVRLILNTCPLWERVWVDRHKPYGLGWGQSHPQYLPTVEKGLGRPTQTLLGQDGVRVIPNTCLLWERVWVDRPKPWWARRGQTHPQYLPTMGKGLDRLTQTLLGQDGVRVNPSTCPLWEKGSMGRPTQTICKIRRVMRQECGVF